ncbi:MAG: DNA-processing protein DprA [Alphaproteobacteria bacterium]|nr:DNA-processing protein DprA [Alphaproteobacteria bacterium]
MLLTPQSQAVLLLNVSLGKSDTGGSKPLARGEWARFAAWLHDNGLEPSVLLKGDLDALLEGWEDRTVTRERLRALLNRGAALGLSLERWERAGLWVLTRSDADYPERLKWRLGRSAPAVLFGCGNRALLGRGGIAVVGSRNAGGDDLAFALKLGADAAAEGYSLVSGGARGIDRHAMQGALERDGTALGVLADSLLRSAMAADYRRYILSGDLALVSPFNPEARFHVGNAMARNACIYCLADAAVVVCSETGKGGTWTGAVENLENRWVPLWAAPDSASGSGNAELVEKGARRLEPGPFSQLMADAPPAGPLFRKEPEPFAPEPPRHGTLAEAAPPPFGEPPQADDGLYTLFLARLADLTAEKPVGVRRIAESLQLRPGQVEDWMRRALTEGRVLAGKRQRQYAILPDAAHIPAKSDLYALFVDRTVSIVSAEPMPTAGIAERLRVTKPQATEWLRRAATDGRLVRRGNLGYGTAEATLFGNNT